VSSSALFISGAAFSHYFVFPAAWNFFAGFSNSYIEFLPRVDPIFGMYVKLMLGIGLTFQLPVLMFVLAGSGSSPPAFCCGISSTPSCSSLSSLRSLRPTVIRHPNHGRRPHGRAPTCLGCWRLAFR
jgi:hypothetical protein